MEQLNATIPLMDDIGHWLCSFRETKGDMDLDPHADPLHKTSHWIHRLEWTQQHAETEPKAQKSTRKGALDGFQAVGKDEVGSSNLPSSSRKVRFSIENRAFFVLFRLFSFCENRPC